jgi:hypothetical protein
MPKLNNPQSHGTKIQAWFVRCFGPTNLYGPGFDFAADPVTGLPVNLKTQKQKTKTVTLSDASAFIADLQPDAPPFLLTIASYAQVGAMKVVREVETFTITPEKHGPLILDGLNEEMIDEWTQMIRDRKRFSRYNGVAASSAIKTLRQPHRGLKIEPKISHSGGSQRRLQCSLPITFLRDSRFQWTSEVGTFRGMRLPILNSPSRYSSQPIDLDLPLDQLNAAQSAVLA